MPAGEIPTRGYSLCNLCTMVGLPCGFLLCVFCILEPVSEYYWDLTTLLNAGYPTGILSFFLYSAWRPARMAQVQQTFELNCLSRTVGNFISSNPSISMDPIQPHSVLGGDIIRFLLALSYQWSSCFVSLKSFQSHLAVKANTNIFLLPNVQLNFIVTCCSAVQWNET